MEVKIFNVVNHAAQQLAAYLEDENEANELAAKLNGPEGEKIYGCKLNGQWIVEEDPGDAPLKKVNGVWMPDFEAAGL